MRVCVSGQWWRVKFHHIVGRERLRAEFCLSAEYPGATAVTICSVELEGSKLSHSDMAVCHESDQFNKERGRRLAFTRAIEPFTREERTTFWGAYWDRKTGRLPPPHAFLVRIPDHPAISDVL